MKLLLFLTRISIKWVFRGNSIVDLKNEIIEFKTKYKFRPLALNFNLIINLLCCQ